MQLQWALIGDSHVCLLCGSGCVVSLHEGHLRLCVGVCIELMNINGSACSMGVITLYFHPYLVMAEGFKGSVHSDYLPLEVSSHADKFGFICSEATCKNRFLKISLNNVFFLCPIQQLSIKLVVLIRSCHKTHFLTVHSTG